MQNSRPYRVYLLYSFLTAMLFRMVFTVNMVYFIQYARLDALQLVLVGTALEVSVFFLEIPTGVVADVYSRRLSVIIGVFLVGAGFLVTGLLPLFLPILLAQVLWGAGWTFTSGALQAWISDEIGEENAAAAFLKGVQVENWGALLGTGLSVALAAVSIQTPILTSGALFLLLGALLIAVMPEDGYSPVPPAERTSWQHFADTFRQGMRMIKARPALLAILGIGFFFGLYSEGYDRLWTASLLERFQFPSILNLPDVTWFGLLGAGSLILSALASGWLQKRVENPPPQVLARWLAAVSGLLILSLLGFVLSGSFVLAILCFWAVDIFRTLASPLYTAWVNHRLDPQVRATVLSVSSQVDALGQIAGGPPVGLVARSAGISTGMLVSVLLLSPVLILLPRQFKGEKG